MDMLIIGGGISGLSTALALEKAGIHATVYEKTQRSTPHAAGVVLGPVAVRALHGLGLPASFWADAAPIRRGLVCTADGEELSAIDIGAIGRTLGHDAMAVPQDARVTALARLLPPGRVVGDADCTAIDQDEDSVTARFRGLGRIRGTHLIGADGRSSAVRAQLFAAASAKPVELCVRGVASRLPDEPETLRETLGQNGRFGHAPAGPAHTVWWAALPVKRSGVPRDPLAVVAELVDGWPGGLSEVVAATPRASVRADIVGAVAPLTQWHRGRIVLLGDAAHPAASLLGHGAALAVEDAIVLARALAATPDAREAFTRYQTERAPRVAQMLVTSGRHGRPASKRASVGDKLRELVIRAAPAHLLEAMMRSRLGFDPGVVAP
jgi:2-polyprenyl-6-methoxyphenol hydroxylase-like FAD-dependent oxidoreductase